MKKLLAAAAAFLCVPGVAAAQEAAAPKFDGVRAEARLGYETPTVSGDGDVYKIGSAVSFGGELGFDFKASDRVVVGPYAVYELSSVELCDGTDCLGVDSNLAGGIRVGAIVSDTVLVYGKLGYASMKVKASSGGVTGSETQGGVQGAIGVDINLGKNFYAMAEMNYGDYGDFYGINLQRRQVAAGLGVRF